MLDTVELDVESLNRNEREFIRNHCEMISLTKCDAVVLGHVGRISEDGNAALQYRGIVVDQVDIRPIDAKSYRLP